MPVGTLEVVARVDLFPSDSHSVINSVVSIAFDGAAEDGVADDFSVSHSVAYSVEDLKTLVKGYEREEVDSSGSHSVAKDDNASCRAVVCNGTVTGDDSDSHAVKNSDEGRFFDVVLKSNRVVCSDSHSV